MDQNNIIESGGFYFIHNFDSGNLGHVERVPTELIAPSVVNPKTNQTETPDYEFNLWTRPDCAGTEFENGNRTWFYFGVQASEPNVLVRLNLINLNKQGKMYNQGMAPVTRTLPGKPQWERIRDRPVHSTDDNTFTLSFKYRTAENLKATTFFAFTYPFSFAELQIALNSIDLKMLPLPPAQSPDDIYYCRECLIYSLEGRRVDLLTISSHHGITKEREDRLRNLFPDNQERPFKFNNKKIIFISARVHPGETPSSFVFNGFLNLLLTRHDPIAIQLRKLYVFKMIPFLNPDGVARGHYRTDTRGVNLNRVYLNPSLIFHPTVYASRALIRYYHYGCEKEDNIDDSKSFTTRSIQNISETAELIEEAKKKKTAQNAQAGYKSGDYRRGVKPAKSATSVKPEEGKKDSFKSLSGAAANLAEQMDRNGVSSAKSATSVKPAEGKKDLFNSLSGAAMALDEKVFDMKLLDMPSVISEPDNSDSNAPEPESASLLNDSVLRSCLGSNVHLSSSEELNLQGANPLRPLRDTLKNSISLLMESNSFVLGDTGIGTKDSRLSNVKMGWCAECRAAMAQMENGPGLGARVVDYNVTSTRVESGVCKNIEEYKERQKQLMESVDEQKSNPHLVYLIKEHKVHIGMSLFPQRESLVTPIRHKWQSSDFISSEEDSGTDREGSEAVYFCTNCFKKYIINASNEEIKLCESGSRSSACVCAGDSAPPAADGTRQTPPKDGKEEKGEKHRAGGARGGKKKAAPPARPKEPDSGLYLYIDLHGHASKKGIFMYGNHFEDVESSVECMLLPRIMSLNNLHFHFSSCNFTERNMYLKDRRDGMSREGSGRVAVLKATGLVRSYTLECNYNTGRLVNVLPPGIRDTPTTPHSPPPPPKYTPHIFEEAKPWRVPPKGLEFFEEMDPSEVGRSLGASILDLTGQHPNSRIPCSEHRNLTAVREWLRAHTKTMRPQLTMSRLRPPKSQSPSRVPLYARSKAKVTEERKENAYVGAKTDTEHKRSPVLSQRSGHDIISMSMRFGKKNEPVKTSSRTKYLGENEPKPKSLAAKRRNVLAIRKPNSSKTQVGGITKNKMARRSADDTESPRTSISSKISKRSFSRSIKANMCRAMASSSSDDVTANAWEDVAGGTALAAAGAPRDPLSAKRRTRSAAAPSQLKKLRLKTAL